MQGITGRRHITSVAVLTADTPDIPWDLDISRFIQSHIGVTFSRRLCTYNLLNNAPNSAQLSQSQQCEVSSHMWFVCNLHVVANEQDMRSDHTKRRDLNFCNPSGVQAKIHASIVPTNQKHALTVGRMKTVNEPSRYLRDQICLQDEVSKCQGLLLP